ncbi:peptidylprolyl isomerase [Nannocystaceae bacterium ST9]
MRQLISFGFVSSLSLLLIACPKAPEPQKTDGVGKVEGKDGGQVAAGDLPAIPEGPVALVNGKEITAADFRAIYDLKLKKYEDRGRDIPKTADRRYRKSIVERLIYQEVLRQEAETRKVSYDKDELAQREEAQKRGIKDWDKHLSRRGESEESLRQLYVTELLERAILEADGKLTVTEPEILEEYEKIKPNYKKDKERIRAAHILVRVGPEERPNPGEAVTEPTDEQKKQWREDALKKANEIYAEVTAPGADFTTLAIKYSEGPSARKGGDLGIFSADRMVEEFSDAAFALAPGEISKPVETKFGFHVIKVFGKYPPGDLPLEALEDQIKERLAARKLHQGRRDLKDELMGKYEIKNIMEELLGPDPRANRRPAATRKSQGTPPGGDPHGDPHGQPISPTAPPMDEGEGEVKTGLPSEPANLDAPVVEGADEIGPPG